MYLYFSGEFWWKNPYTLIVSRNACAKEAPFSIYWNGNEFCETVDISAALSGLLAMYFVFDIHYSNKAKRTLTFYQKCVLKLNDNVKLPSSLMNLANLIVIFFFFVHMFIHLINRIIIIFYFFIWFYTVEYIVYTFLLNVYLI